MTDVMTGQPPAREVREARTARAWTQAHLAGVAGVDARTVRRIEAGKIVDPGSMAAVAEALGIAPVGHAPADGSTVTTAGSPLLRYVASVEAVEGLWTCTDVPAWLALRDWDEARLARAGADGDAASDVECSIGFVAIIGFFGMSILAVATVPLLGDILGERARSGLATGLATAMLVMAGLTWVAMTVVERRRRKAEALESKGLEVVREGRRLGARVHVLGPAGATTFEVAAAGSLRRTFVPVEAMALVAERRSGPGHVTLSVRVAGRDHLYEHLANADAMCAVADGWRRTLDGISRVGVAA